MDRALAPQGRKLPSSSALVDSNAMEMSLGYFLLDTVQALIPQARTAGIIDEDSCGALNSKFLSTGGPNQKYSALESVR